MLRQSRSGGRQRQWQRRRCPPPAARPGGRAVAPRSFSAIIARREGVKRTYARRLDDSTVMKVAQGSVETVYGAALESEWRCLCEEKV